MIDINLITDREIKELNKKWFGRSYATDVIAFPPLPVPPPPAKQPAGKRGGRVREGVEVYISIDTAKRQARERSVSLQGEILRLIVHGVTHVEGYNDLNLSDFKKMREREWERLIRII